MNKILQCFWLALFLLAPLKAYGQEDTCYVPDLYGTNQFLNTIIANDTAGTGWKGAGGITAWENHTRVYVLKKNGSYPWNATIQLRANRKLVIRAENGNYVPGGDWKPLIYGYPVGGAYPGRIINLNQLNDTLILKNVSICGIDESTAGGLDKVQGNMIEIQSTGSGSILIDSCVLKTINGQLMQIGASGACHANTIRITNTILADMGFLGMSNLGAGRGIDFRNSEVDSVDIRNCTFVNFQDRIVRHLLSLQPIHSFKFNHNTVLNGMSYCGTISLGWVDSLGNGPFEIKDNLFLDNFAMGPDTDLVRQSEFTDNPEMDSRNGFSKITWIVVRPNTTAHVTPWVVRNNYYAISDSGKAIRQLTSPYLYVPNPDTTEPIMTADLKRQVQANGGDTLTAFRRVKIVPTKIPPLMTKLIRWYYSPESDGSPADYTNTGAGAGRKKTGSSGTPASHFIHDATNNVWVYDFNRRTTGWYFDSLDAGYQADVDMSTAASDGKIIGSTMWSFKGIVPGGPTVVEDTCYVPDLYGKNQYLNAIIAADTAGSGWKGASGATAWRNHTRVYVLQKNGFYPWNATIQLRANRKLVIRAEQGNYVPGGDWKPSIYAYPVTGAYPGRIINLNQANDTLILKNVSICGIDESTPGGLDKVQGNMIEIQSTGSGSIFVDSCLLKTINGQLMQIGASGACHANTIKITNTILADMGFLGMSNLGAGRGIDFRNSEVDNVEISNCTFVNFQDRIVRHLLSLQPIHSFKFNHNTVLNGMSYCGTISLGWVDSLSSGPFEIKDNLFVDNFAMGPDTDLVRQSEFTDNPENDPRNGFSKITWIVARPNTTAHVTPWVIANNYYCISDSGEAMRQLSAPYLYAPNPNAVEPIMTADMKRQLQANGGDTTTAFRKVARIALTKVPPLMTKMIRWYYSPESDGSPADYTNTGAGAGRKKTGSSGTPASHFIHDATNNVWVYDFNRRPTGWYYDSLDAGYRATTDLSTAASDGKVVGSTMWSFKGILESVDKNDQLPLTYSLEQNYPNPFNPSTKIVYALPHQSKVKLEVFDILGRKVATLVDRVMLAGRYNVEFSGESVSSGVYVYRLTTPSTVLSKKMLLVK